jgi:hypothetical protein
MPGIPVMINACCQGLKPPMPGQSAIAPSRITPTIGPPSRNTIPAPITPPMTNIDMAKDTRSGGKLSPMIE